MTKYPQVRGDLLQVVDLSPFGVDGVMRGHMVCRILFFSQSMLTKKTNKVTTIAPWPKYPSPLRDLL